MLQNGDASPLSAQPPADDAVTRGESGLRSKFSRFSVAYLDFKTLTLDDMNPSQSAERTEASIK